MNISDFCKTAKKSNWKIYIMNDSRGYCVFQTFAGDEPEFIQTQRGKIRYWKSLDVLVKNISAAGFAGDVQLEISQQLTL